MSELDKYQKIPRKEGEKIIGFASAQFSGNIKYLYLQMTKYP